MKYFVIHDWMDNLWWNENVHDWDIGLESATVYNQTQKDGMGDFIKDIGGVWEELPAIPTVP